MTDKVNGWVQSGQHLVGSLAMFTVTTTNNIVTPVTSETDTDPFGSVTVTTASHNDALDALIAAIGTRAEPVIIGTPAGTGPYTLNFAVEHADVFGDLTAFANEVMLITGGTVSFAPYSF